MKLFKRCLNVTMGVVLFCHTATGQLNSNNPDHERWREIDRLLQTQYQHMLAFGMLPSLAQRELEEEFEAHGCNSSVVGPAVKAHNNRSQSLEQQFGINVPYTTDMSYEPLADEELEAIYGYVDYNSECGRTLALIQAIESGIIHKDNFSPVDESGKYNPEGFLHAVAWELTITVLAAAVGAVTTVIVTKALEEDKSQKQQELQDIRNRLDDISRQLADIRLAQREQELRQREEELKREKEALRQRAEELEKKITEVDEELAARKKDGPGENPNPDEDYRCMECVGEERERLWVQFNEQLQRDFVACDAYGKLRKADIFIDDRQVRVDLHDATLVSSGPLRVPLATMVKARTCDSAALEKSLREKSITRAESKCNLHVETIADCKARLSGQRQDGISSQEKAEFMSKDCRLHTYPYLWKAGEPPIESVEDCEHMQKQFRRLSWGPDESKEDRMKKLATAVLTSQECHPEVAKEYQGAQKRQSLDPRIQVQMSLEVAKLAAQAVEKGDYEAAMELAQQSSPKEPKPWERSYTNQSQIIALDNNLSTKEKDKQQCMLDQQIWAMGILFGDAGN